MQIKQGLKGYIANISTNNIRGWVAKDGQKAPVRVELWINDKKIAQTNANLFRKDTLEKGIHKTGKCGFEFEQIATLYRGDRIQVKAGQTKQVLESTSLARQQKARLLRRTPLLIPNECYFFIHIPKTAGTSFRSMLYDLFKPAEVIPNTLDIKSNGGLYPRLLNLLKKKDNESIAKVKLLAGHYVYQPNLYFKKTPKVMVFLRDPIQRAVSRLFHIKRHHPQLKVKSFEEIFESRPLVDFNDVQLRFIIGNLKPRLMTREELEIAKKNLESFSFVGITDQFGASIDLLERTMGWQFPNRVIRNVNKVYKMDELPQSLVEKIKEINQLDQELYEFGVALFEKRKTQFLGK